MAEVLKERALATGSQLADIIASRANAVCVAEDDFFHQLVEYSSCRDLCDGRCGKDYLLQRRGSRTLGVPPELGQSEWCGSWKLFWPDGRSMPHDQCPMAVAIKERRPVRGLEAIAERPDGTRVPFIPFPTPMFNSGGQFVGAVNLLVDISDRKHAEDAMYRLAAIVASSDDAIIGKIFKALSRIGTRVQSEFLGT